MRVARPLVRALVYSVFLAGLLTYLSYVVYTTPGQVEARLLAGFRGFLQTTPRLEGCASSFPGSLVIERLEVPAAPVLLERNILELRDLRLEDPTTRRAFRFGQRAEAAARWPTVRIASGELLLHREWVGPAGEERARWNFDDLVQPRGMVQLLAARHAQILVDQLKVSLRETRPLREAAQWQMELRDVELRPGELGEALLEADLPEAPGWSGGRIALSYSQRAWSAHATVDDFRAIEAWLPLVGSGAPRSWRELHPRGAFDLDLEVESAASGGPPSFRAEIQHYDSELAPGSLGPTLRQVRGRMLLERDALSWPPADGARGAQAEVWGLPARLVGRLSDEGGGALEMHLQPGALDALLGTVLAGTTSPWATWVLSLGLEGQVAGTVSWRRAPGGKEALPVDLLVTGAATRKWRLLEGASGRLTFEGETASPLTGSGRFALEKGQIFGLGPAAGLVSFDWGSGGLHVRFSDLKVEKASPRAGGTGAPDAERQYGSLFGEAQIDPEKGLQAFELRWLSVPLDLPLVRVGEVSGEYRAAPGSPRGSGRFDLARAQVPAGLFPGVGEPREYSLGELRLELADAPTSRWILRQLRLTGEGRTLRATGEVSTTGELSLVVLLCEGPTQPAVDRLGPEATPSQWKDAARGSYRAFRITGSLTAPAAREIGENDPVFREP